MRKRKTALFTAGLMLALCAMLLGASWAQDQPTRIPNTPAAALSESPGSKPGKRTGIRCVLRVDAKTTSSTRPSVLVTYTDDGITWAVDKYDGAWSLSGNASKGGGLNLKWSGSWWERYALVLSIQRFGGGICEGEHFKF